MGLVVESKRRKLPTLSRLHPGAAILDLTSRGAQPWVKFSPFYPHGNIPIPLSPGHVAASVEGIWQGLKVFAGTDIDPGSFTNRTMKGLKRTQRVHGRVLGHRAGVHGSTLLSYRDARYQIYLPAYLWVLEHCVQMELQQLRDLMESRMVVLLDYGTHSSVDDLSRPLSHAALVARYLQDQWPR